MVSKEMKIKLRERLSYKQTRNTILIALILGIIVSLFQIVIDFFEERKRVDSTISQTIAQALEPAALAAFNLDKQMAQNVVSGLFRYQPIYEAKISDETTLAPLILNEPAILIVTDWPCSVFND